LTTDSESYYDFENVEGIVPIANDLPCSFIFDQREIRGRAKISLDLKNRGGIKIDVGCDPTQLSKISFPNDDIKEIILNNHKIRVFVSNIRPDPIGIGLTFTPNIEPIQFLGDDNTKISKIIFHLFNFKDSKGTARKLVSTSEFETSRAVTELISNEWKIELHHFSLSKKSENPLHLTHIGYVSKVDDSQFDGKTAHEILANLYWFFSFCQATFCSPVLPIGIDPSGKTVWLQANSPRKSDSGELSWFDPHHSEELSQLFPKFLSIANNEKWGDTLHHAIYWYVRSNNSSGTGIDSGIILTQVAIERLGYEYAVNQRRLIESKGFKDLKASDKFRLLFSSLDLPIDISDSTPKIKSVAEKFGYIDNPHFLTDVRNSLVHPDHKRQKDFSTLYYDTWRLGLWYLELAILKICDYHGTYANRLTDGLWVGQVECVPWDKRKDGEDS